MTIQIIGPDDFAACPQCGVRLDPDIDPETNDNRVVDEDEDGPIYLGTCMEHGAFNFQIVDDEDESLGVFQSFRRNI